jgi:hypothetical protein
LRLGGGALFTNIYALTPAILRAAKGIAFVTP